MSNGVRMKHAKSVTLNIIALLLIMASTFFTTQAMAAYQSGKASWYGAYHHGKRTASGERFNMHALTAAHRTLPFGTIVQVKNRKTGKTVKVKINDRGPYHGNRIIDLSRGAASQIGMVKSGVGNVDITILSKPAKTRKSRNTKRNYNAMIVTPDNDDLVPTTLAVAATTAPTVLAVSEPTKDNDDINAMLLAMETEKHINDELASLNLSASTVNDLLKPTEPEHVVDLNTTLDGFSVISAESPINVQVMATVENVAVALTTDLSVIDKLRSKIENSTLAMNTATFINTTLSTAVNYMKPLADFINKLF